MCFHKCILYLPAETEEGDWAMVMFYVRLFFVWMLWKAVPCLWLSE